MAKLITIVAGLLVASIAAAAEPAPQLADPRAAEAQVLTALTNARQAPDGTVFMGVRISNDGSVAVGPVYGAPVRDDRFATILRIAAEQLRFQPGAPREWAIYWMFQSNGCEPAIYDVPPDVTPIRVCLAVAGGTLIAPRSAVWFGSLAELRAGHGDGATMPKLKADLPPASVRALEGRVAGRAILALTLTRDGHVTQVELPQSFGGDDVRTALREWALASQWKVPGSWWNAHADRVLYVWYEFAISDECRKETPPRAAPGIHVIYSCRAMQVT